MIYGSQNWKSPTISVRFLFPVESGGAVAFISPNSEQTMHHWYRIDLYLCWCFQWSGSYEQTLGIKQAWKHNLVQRKVCTSDLQGNLKVGTFNHETFGGHQTQASSIRKTIWSISCETQFLRWGNISTEIPMYFHQPARGKLCCTFFSTEVCHAGSILSQFKIFEVIENNWTAFYDKPYFTSSAAILSIAKEISKGGSDF